MDVFGKIILIFSAVAYIIALLHHIRNAILILVPILKCRNVKGCEKDDCPFRRGCRRIAYSDKEKAKMRSLIDSLK